MRKKWKTAVTTTAVLATFAVGPTLYAQSTPATPQSGGGMMMMQGNQGGMMNMMEQMSKMMEGCNTMMKSMNQGSAAETSNEGQKPELKR